jgi:hypothetical protein
MSIKLVNVVATLNLSEGSGEILYVNPVSSDARADAVKMLAAEGLSPPGPPAAGLAPPQARKFELRFEDASGHRLALVHPNIKVSACEVERYPDPLSRPASREVPTTAMINEFVPYMAGMASVALLYEGVEKHRFKAGVPGATGAGMALGFPGPESGHRRTLRAVAGVEPQPGVSYTVQVMPAGTKTWQTIAAARETPAVPLDRNQFPGAKKARVRVLRNTGFDSEVFVEEDISLNF